jgi:hypothetical protein
MEVRPLSTAWTQNLQGDAKKDFEQIVRNSTQLLKRLKDIIEANERAQNNLSFSLSDFSDPNWSHKQAFRNGKLSALKELKELIPF